jgi:hypothetical protein
MPPRVPMTPTAHRPDIVKQVLVILISIFLFRCRRLIVRIILLLLVLMTLSLSILKSQSLLMDGTNQINNEKYSHVYIYVFQI